MHTFTIGFDADYHAKWAFMMLTSIDVKNMQHCGKDK
jgi:hypothetical protein